MRKIMNLTNRLKQKIVKTQIDFIKKKHPNDLINYDTLRSYLTESLKENFSEEAIMDEEIDYRLLNNLEEADKGKGTRFRLLRAVRTKNNLNRGLMIKNKNFVDFYEMVEIKGVWPRNYGEKSHQLLGKYLMKKELLNYINLSNNSS